MSDDERGLDAELRRLFSDDRLTLPVANDAERVIVAGARRRRRRRLAVASAGGVLAVAALVSTGIGVAGLGRAPSTISAATAVPTITLTTTSSAAPGPVAPTQFGVLGPFGVGPIRLGMSLDALKPILRTLYPATDKMVSKCVSYETVVLEFVEVVDGRGDTTVRTVPPSTAVPGSRVAKQLPFPVEVVIAPSGDVVQIGGDSLLRTPEGVGIGTPVAELYRIYQAYAAKQQISGSPQVTPAWPRMSASGAPTTSALTVSVPGNPDAGYVFGVDGGKVSQIWLRSSTAAPC